MTVAVWEKVRRWGSTTTTTACVALALMVSGSPAAADPPPDGRGCLDQLDWGVGIQQIGSSTDNDVLGTRAEVLVSGEQPACQRISSVYVVGDTGGLYEFGWLRGYSTCPGETAWRDRPTVFFLSQQASGAKDCDVIGLHPSGGQLHTFVAYDSAGDSIFRSYLNGALVSSATKNMSFIQGILQLGAERANLFDNSYARFDQVSENHAGNGWTFTEHLSEEIDTDPDYEASTIDGHTARVIDP